MRIVTSVKAMQEMARRWRRKGIRVGFVPTMGCLHAGHISLVQRARKLAGKTGVVVVSLYVNPTQFGPREDFNRYPRNLARDTKLCRPAGVDVLFAPDNRQMYAGDGPRPYCTYVVEEDLSKRMEGVSRPTHFRGVTTIVAKLFNIVLPDVAVFGAKDFQQAAIIQRMTRDLNFPVRIVVAPTIREPDGLALSSRNKYLTGDLRAQATALRQALLKARAAVRVAKTPPGVGRLKQQLKRFIEAQPAARVDYLELFEPATLRPVATARRGTHLAMAVFVGRTRLIDNARL